MPTDWEYWLSLALGICLALAVAAGVYATVGSIGVMLLGIGIAFIAVRADLEGDAPVGGDTTEGLFAATIAARQAETRQGHPRHASGARRRPRLSTCAQVIGALITAVGLGLIWLQA
jgi:hypothetical protein